MTTHIVEIPENTILHFEDWSLDASKASPATLAYLLQNGYHQAMVDAGALSTEAKAKIGDDAAVKAKLVEKRQAKHEAIIAGTVGVRVASKRVSLLDRFIREVTDERLAAIAAKKGAKLPHGKGSAEKMEALRTKFLADDNRKAAVHEEAQRRFDATQADADFDFSDDEAHNAENDANPSEVAA